MLWLRLPSLGASNATKFALDRERAARTAFEATSPTPVQADVVIGALDAVTPLGGRSIPVELRRSFSRALGGYLVVRASADVDAYVRWMKDSGYRLPDDYVAPEGFTIDHYRQVSGRESPPDGFSSEDYFRTTFEYERRQAAGADVPAQLASGPDGVVEYFYWSTDPRGTSPDIPTDLVPVDSHWYGTRALFGSPWWKPPIAYGEVLERDGGVLCAVVWFGCQGRTGVWFTVKTTWFHDPQRGQWILDRYFYDNVHELNHHPML